MEKFNTESPQQEIRTTTKSTEALAQGEHPQKIYETKKTIFRSNQVIWYIFRVTAFFSVLIKTRKQGN